MGKSCFLTRRKVAIGMFFRKNFPELQFYRRKGHFFLGLLAVGGGCLSDISSVWADAPSENQVMEGMDTLWVVVAAVLVLFMQAGFAFLETGLSRGKNAGHLATKNLVILGVSSLVFWAIGFGISFSDGNSIVGMHGFFVNPFGPDADKLFPSLSYSDATMASKILFQTAFCAVSLAIVWGGMAERVRFPVYIIFGTVFSGLIYPVVGHWIWGNGWLSRLGMQDFAGSTVVHLQGALSALAGTLLLGPRLGKYRERKVPLPIPGHNIPFVILGTMILWLGWFGFNPGSTLGVNIPAPGYFAYVAMTTNLAAAAGVLAATFMSWALLKAPDMSMMANGALAALVAITASCAFVTPLLSVVIGAIAGVIAVIGVLWVDRKGIDDPVGAVSVHGMAGIWGTLSTGLFAAPDRVRIVGVGQPGLFYGGGWHQLGVQFLGIMAVSVYVFSVSLLVFYLIRKGTGLRVTAAQEAIGLDFAEHKMWGYPDAVRASAGATQPILKEDPQKDAASTETEAYTERAGGGQG
ncbi:Ammonium transporter [Leptospirillum ferriphilum]|uniref:Ammonium transporter n=3 Tax=Leptospirillum ferriphilum TaxID=178606 RepID=A0A094W9G3_9BACT|nr:Ammonium transporter [Leptospirillum ferriphilum]